MYTFMTGLCACLFFGFYGIFKHIRSVFHLFINVYLLKYVFADLYSYLFLRIKHMDCDLMRGDFGYGRIVNG